MKKFVYKFLAVVVSFVTAIAMIPLSNGSVAYAEKAQVQVTLNISRQQCITLTKQHLIKLQILP